MGSWEKAKESRPSVGAGLGSRSENRDAPLRCARRPLTFDVQLDHPRPPAATERIPTRDSLVGGVTL